MDGVALARRIAANKYGVPYETRGRFDPAAFRSQQRLTPRCTFFPFDRANEPSSTSFGLNPRLRASRQQGDLGAAARERRRSRPPIGRKAGSNKVPAIWRDGGAVERGGLETVRPPLPTRPAACRPHGGGPASLRSMRGRPVVASSALDPPGVRRSWTRCAAVSGSGFRCASPRRDRASVRRATTERSTPPSLR